MISFFLKIKLFNFDEAWRRQSAHRLFLDKEIIGSTNCLDRC